MNKRKNIKYIVVYALCLLIFMGLSFTTYGIPKDLWMYIAIYSALFILPSVVLYFSNFESGKKEELKPANRIKHIASNKFGWLVFFMLILCSSVIYISTSPALVLLGIVAVLFLIIVYLGHLIYKFFVKKEPVVPLLWTGIDVFEQKPFQYFFITCIIICFISILFMTALFMNFLYSDYVAPLFAFVNPNYII